MQPVSAPGASAQGPAQLELAQRAFDGIFPSRGPVAQTDRAAVSFCEAATPVKCDVRVRRS